MDNPSNERPAPVDRAMAQAPLQHEFLQSLDSHAKTPLQQLQESLRSEPRIPSEFKISPEFTDPPEFIHRLIRERENPNQPLTPEHIEQVRTQMEKSVNELIPSGEQATLKQLRDGVLDSNPGVIETAYEKLKENPKLLHAMVNELNSEFKQQGTNVSFSLSDDNRLIVSADGHNGVEFGGNGPEAKQVTRGQDGYIHLSQDQGESLSLDQVMKDLQKNACRDDINFLLMENPYRTISPYFNPARPFFKPYEPSVWERGEIWDKTNDLTFPPH
jgi:uncharacterized FlaG/YvyC family protein